MRMYSLSSVAWVCVASAYAWAQPADVSQDLAPLLKEHKVPALAVLVLRGDAVVASGIAGVRAEGRNEPATLEDLWHLGSCTKSMTATMLATFVESGKLSWSSTIGEMLPDVQPMDPAWKDVTLGQLLAHRAGVPADLNKDGLWGRLWNHAGTPREQRATLVAALLAEPPLSAPGEKYLYANAGFTIAAAMAERIADKPWEELMQERLFGPLGITTAGFGAPGEPEVWSQPRGHDAQGKPVEPGPNHAGDNPAAIGPGGTVHMSLEDWGRYISLHLAGEMGTSKLLKPETLRAMHRPYEADGSNYGWGWSFTTRPWAGGRTITHSGSNTLWMAVVWIAPEKDMAALVVCNRGGQQGAKACDAAVGEMVKRLIAPEQRVERAVPEPR